MSGSGGFALSRRHGGDRFYSPPAARQHQHEQMLLQQQQHQLPRAPVKSESSSDAAMVETENRRESDDSTKALSRSSSVRSASSPRPMPVNITNLDRLVESVNPFIPAQNFSEQQQHQLPRAPVKSESSSDAAMVETENRRESDDSTKALSRSSSVRSASSPRPMPVNITNLDRLVESVTPFIPAQNFSEVRGRGRKTQQVESHQFYCLEDLWESFREWSVYGAGVPLLLNGKDPITQYYVPYLSGMQLYTDASKPSPHLRRSGKESDAESSRETSSAGSSDCEADKLSKSEVDGCRNHQNAQQLNRLSVTDKFIKSSSSDEAETSNMPGLLLFEYLEQEQPHLRKPLTDKISILASQFPDLRCCRSCDLLPSSWISVAWYPIYRIPMSPTLKDLDASF